MGAFITFKGEGEGPVVNVVVDVGRELLVKITKNDNEIVSMHLIQELFQLVEGVMLSRLCARPVWYIYCNYEQIYHWAF